MAVRERDELLSLTTMLFVDEIRDPEEIEAVPSRTRGRRRGAARSAPATKVINAMTRDFDPSRYRDCHRSRLMKIIRSKRTDGEVEIPEVEPEPSPVPDLMAALKESLARVRQTV